MIEKSRILVSGGAGFVGSNLVRLLLGEGAAHVHVVDKLLSAERVNVPEDRRVRFSEASIADERLLAGLEDEYDYVFHLSTYHGNQSSIHDPLADHENNTVTTLRLYERIKGFKRLKKVVYSAAGCSVAGKTFAATAATEESDLVSLWMDSPYSMSKVFGEFYSTYYFKRHGLPTVRARFQNVYGPGEILGAGRWRGTAATVWRNVTPTFIWKALHGEPLPLENEGAAARDFIYVEDVARGLAACALRGELGSVYNVASGVETRIRDLAERVNRLAGSAAGVKMLPKRDWASESRLDPRLHREACRASAGRMTDAAIDQANAKFWNELCGTTFAKALGIADHSLDSLRRFDRAYMDLYPYLLKRVPVATMRDKRVLEVGLGYGTLGQKLAEAGADYTGLDIAQGPVEMMNHRLRLQRLPGRAIQGSILDCPLPNASVDCVVAIGCFHHTGNMARCMDETWRVLKPGGTAYLMVYNRFSYLRWLRWFLPTLRAALRRGAAGTGTATESERRVYDLNTAGEAAPETVFASRSELRFRLRHFSRVSMSLENSTALTWAGAVVIPRRALLSTLGRIAGLDIYVAATK